MKALQIQTPARVSFRAILRRTARVFNPSDTACLSVGIAAILVFFACLGLMCVPGIIASGLTALTCAAIAPMGDADTTVDKEGGES